MTYPKELRERVLSKHQSGLGRNAIARELSVSTGWVSKVLHCYEVYGELMPPRKKPGRKPKITEHAQLQIQKWVDDEPDLTLRELAERLSDLLGMPVNQVNVFCALKAMGYSHKKNSCS